MSYGVGSGFGASSRDESGTFSAYAIYAPENAEKLEIAFKDEIRKATTEGFTAEEVNEAVKGWLQSQQVSRANDRELAGRIAGHISADRTIAWEADLENRISQLTPAQVNAAMKKYITPDKITIIKVGDFAKAKPKPVQ